MEVILFKHSIMLKFRRITILEQSTILNSLKVMLFQFN